MRGYDAAVSAATSAAASEAEEARQTRIWDAICSSEKTDPIPGATRYYKWLNEGYCEGAE